MSMNCGRESCLRCGGRMQLVKREKIQPVSYTHLFQIDLRIEKALNIAPGKGSDLFEHAAGFSDDDALVAFPFAVDRRADVDIPIFAFFKIGYLHSSACLLYTSRCV